MHTDVTYDSHIQAPYLDHSVGFRPLGGGDIPPHHRSALGSGSFHRQRDIEAPPGIPWSQRGLHTSVRLPCKWGPDGGGSLSCQRSAVGKTRDRPHSHRHLGSRAHCKVGDKHAAASARCHSAPAGMKKGVKQFIINVH